jgi:hypothetical protein
MTPKAPNPSGFGFLTDNAATFQSPVVATNIGHTGLSSAFSKGLGLRSSGSGSGSGKQKRDKMPGGVGKTKTDPVVDEFLTSLGIPKGSVKKTSGTETTDFTTVTGTQPFVQQQQNPADSGIGSGIGTGTQSLGHDISEEGDQDDQ